MKCEHKGRLYQFAVVYGPTTAGVIASGNAGHTVAGQCRCEACGEVVPLGHSDEEPVRVEVRAAEIAEAFPKWPADFDEREGDGWFAHASASDYTADRDDEWWWAGWFARHIANSKETP